MLLADRLEIQALTGDEPALLASFAELVAATRSGGRGSPSPARSWTPSSRPSTRSRRGSAPSPATSRGAEPAAALRARTSFPLEAAAVVMADDQQTRYAVEECHGWAAEFEGREVALDEDTWAAWVLRSAEEALPARRRGRAHEAACRILVLDEGCGAGGVAAGRAATAREPHAGGARPHRAARRLRRRRRTACSASSPTRRRPRSRVIRTSERQKEQARARRPHRPLQPPRVRRAARPGARARGPPGGPLRAAAPRPRPLQEAQRHASATPRATPPCAHCQGAAARTSARATWPRATAARSSW